MTSTGTTPAAGVDHPLARAMVTSLDALVPAVDPDQIRLWQLGDDQCLTTSLTLQHVEAVVAAAKLQLLGAMEERQVTQHTTALGTAAWLNGTTASTLPAAYGEVGLARGVYRRFPAILAAMTAAAVSKEQAAAIVGVLKRLPDTLSAEEVQSADKTMIGFAETHGPKGLRDLLGSGTRISPAEARRLACDADILPAVLGSDSQLLDLGRSTRLFTGDLRQAIALRDQGCVFPGCHREPRDCDAHHIVPWTENGPTSYVNAALVCPTHHRLVEPDPAADRTTDHERWHVRMSRDGIPEVIPPAINDEHRQPQRHRRFLLRR